MEILRRMIENQINRGLYEYNIIIHDKDIIIELPIGIQTTDSKDFKIQKFTQIIKRDRDTNIESYKIQTHNAIRNIGMQLNKLMETGKFSIIDDNDKITEYKATQIILGKFFDEVKINEQK